MEGTSSSLKSSSASVESKLELDPVVNENYLVFMLQDEVKNRPSFAFTAVVRGKKEARTP